MRSGQCARYILFPTLSPEASMIGVITLRQVKGGTVDSKIIKLPSQRCGTIEFVASITISRFAALFFLSSGVGTAMMNTSASHGVDCAFKF